MMALTGCGCFLLGRREEEEEEEEEWTGARILLPVESSMFVVVEVAKYRRDIVIGTTDIAVVLL